MTIIILETKIYKQEIIFNYQNFEEEMDNRLVLNILIIKATYYHSVPL